MTTINRVELGDAWVDAGIRYLHAIAGDSHVLVGFTTDLNFMAKQDLSLPALRTRSSQPAIYATGDRAQQKYHQKSHTPRPFCRYRADIRARCTAIAAATATDIFNRAMAATITADTATTAP